MYFYLLIDNQSYAPNPVSLRSQQLPSDFIIRSSLFSLSPVPWLPVAGFRYSVFSNRCSVTDYRIPITEYRSLPCTLCPQLLPFALCTALCALRPLLFALCPATSKQHLNLTSVLSPYSPECFRNGINNIGSNNRFIT